MQGIKGCGLGEQKQNNTQLQVNNTGVILRVHGGNQFWKHQPKIVILEIPLQGI